LAYLQVELSLLQAEPMLGMAMTYTLFEYAKENAEMLFANQPEIEPIQVRIFFLKLSGFLSIS